MATITDLSPRILSLNCGNGFTVTICIDEESSPGVARGKVYARGPKPGATTFEGEADFAPNERGTGIRVSNGFTTVQRHELSVLIETAISLHRFNF